MDIIIGVDPDSYKNGVAVFVDEKLEELKMCNSIELFTFLELVWADSESIKFVIEDVKSNNFSYARRSPRITKARDKAAAAYKMGADMGKCQQAQTEIERVCEHLDIQVVKHKPHGSEWAKNKLLFENATGWTKSSNKDNRMAAYFAYCEIERCKNAGG